MDSSSAFTYRPWPANRESEAGASDSSQALAWQVSSGTQAVLILVDTQPSALRSLARQLPAQPWHALVLPAEVPTQSEFSIFHAQLGKPRIFARNDVQESGL